MKQIKILIADDHELFREGLKSRLESTPGWTLCGEAADGHQAVELAARHQPTVAVLDIGMARLNGIDAARQIRKVSPATSILILTMQDCDELIQDALEAGARGFLFKTDAARLLPVAIESLLAGRPFFTPHVSGLVLNGFLSPNPGARDTAASRHILTEREREIVQLLAEAHTSKEIAGQLGVSVKTIEAHRSNVMRKLQLHSIAELVRYAIRNNLVNP